MNRRERLIDRTRQGYRRVFGPHSNQPLRFFAAPGRVNLIGEHVDYNEGLVLPCAINRETVVAIGPTDRESSFIEAVAIDEKGAHDRFLLDEPIAATGDDWAKLVRGCAARLQARGHHILPMKMAIAGNVPIGAGLSSSASFAVAVTFALCQTNGLSLSSTQVALVAQEAENQFLGTQCGIMDQMASSSSESGRALLLDCRSLETRSAPVAPNLAVVIIDSGVRRQLASSGFNQRREECEEAARALGVTSLRDVTLETLEASKGALSPTLHARARHVVSEIARVEPMARALANGDTAALAAIMRDSHASLRDDYEVTVPPVDRLAELIDTTLGTDEGALGGVRMTGAGFGGCLVAVVSSDAAEMVLDAVETVYNATADIPASADIYAMAGGAHETSL